MSFVEEAEEGGGGDGEEHPRQRVEEGEGDELLQVFDKL